MPIDSCRPFLRAHSIRLSWVSQFRWSVQIGLPSQPRSLAGSKVQYLRVEYRSGSLPRQKFETQIVCRCLRVQTRGLQIDGKFWSAGMTSQKKSSYGHFSIYSSSPFFFFLRRPLRVASTHYFNPVSNELVGLITLLFSYCNYLLCYCYYFFYFLLKIFIAENEKKAFRHGNIHTYIFIPVSKRVII